MTSTIMNSENGGDGVDPKTSVKYHQAIYHFKGLVKLKTGTIFFLVEIKVLVVDSHHLGQ